METPESEKSDACESPIVTMIRIESIGKRIIKSITFKDFSGTATIHNDIDGNDAYYTFD